MTDEKRGSDDGMPLATDLSRRDFVALSLAAGLAAAADNVVSAAELPVEAVDVDVKTPDGVCDTTFIHPTISGRVRSSSSRRQ